MIPFHRVVPHNRFGRDFVIGDLHGHVPALKEALSARSFIPGRDRLFSVGDLVDRGPDSPGAAELVRENWFHAVRGNHEDMLLRSVRGEGTRITDIWRENGGEWGMNGWIPNAAARAAAVFLEELPYAITLHHKSGLRVGICHAEYPLHDWSMVGQLDADDEYSRAMLWGRERIGRKNHPPVTGIDLTIHGHTLVRNPLLLANALFIETGAFLGERGRLTLLCLDDVTLGPDGIRLPAA
jgi:serine/threonine protein phosphatase 1